MAHGLHRPQREGQLLRRAAGLPAVGVEQLLQRQLAGLPGGLGGHAAGVEAVEVAAGGQAVRVLDGVAAVAGGDVAAFQAGQQRAQFVVGTEGRVPAAGLLRARAGRRVQAVGQGAVLQQRLQPPVRRALRQCLPVGHQLLVGLFTGAGHGFPEVAAQHRQHGGDAPAFFAARAEGVQSHRLRRARQLVQVVVHQLHEGRELGLAARGAPAEVAVDALGAHCGQELQAQLLLHAAFVLRLPLVQQVVDVRQRRVQPGRRERRRLVAQDHRPAAALGLRGLADVVDDVRVQHRHVAHRQHRVVEHRQPAFLARQPFLRAVGAEVHQRIGAEARACPQVGGQVVVRRNGAGVVVQRTFLVVAAFAARGLWQQAHVAQSQPRHHEDRRAAFAQHHGAALRRAPALLQPGLHRGGQRLQPGVVLRHRQAVGEAVAQQRAQHLLVVGRAVAGCQQALQLRRQRTFGQGLGAVARSLQRGQRAAQAARQVHERGRQVLLAAGVVPEEDGHVLVGRGLALQAHQVQRLGHHGRGLRRDGLDLLVAGARGHRDLDVGDARVLGLRQVEGHVHQLHALRVGGPLRGVAAAVGHGLHHRQAQRLELPAPALGVQRDLRVDEHVGHRAAVQQQHAAHRVGLHHAAVEGQGDGAGGLDARDEVVDERGLFGGDALLVEGDGHRGRAPRRVHALPAQVGRRRGQHQTRCARVVHARRGEHLRRRQRLPGAALQVRGQRLQQVRAVGLAAVDVVGVQALRQRGVEPATRPHGRGGQPGVRARGQRRQRGVELAAHEVFDVLARRVEEHQVGALPKRRCQVAGRQLLDELRFDAQPERGAGLRQHRELARRHRAAGDEEHAAGLRHAAGADEAQGATEAQQPGREMHRGFRTGSAR